jgi:hypothetical protein
LLKTLRKRDDLFYAFHHRRNSLHTLHTFYLRQNSLHALYRCDSLDPLHGHRFDSSYPLYYGLDPLHALHHRCDSLQTLWAFYPLGAS